MDKKTQYCQDIRSSNLVYRFSAVPQQVICGHGQTDSKVYMERQKTQNSQYHIEGEKQSGWTDSTQLQDLTIGLGTKMVE